MTLDHIVPVARGGVCTLDNVSLACHDCNTAKAAMSREEYRESLGAGTVFWGEGQGTRPAARMVIGGRRLALLGSVAVLLTGLCATATAQIVRYKAAAHGYPIFVAGIPTPVTSAIMCAAVGRLASNIARARDAGVSLQASLQVVQGGPGTLGETILVAMLYQTPTITPPVAQQLAEGGCLAAEHSGQGIPADVASQAVRR